MPRFSIRLLLILIAVSALIIGGERMRRRRAYCLRKSLEHRSRLFMISMHLTTAPMAPEAERKLARTDPHAAWHLKVSDAYLHCASHPWEAVPAEPEEPFSFPPP